jgi:hypothetical protein
MLRAERVLFESTYCGARPRHLLPEKQHQNSECYSPSPVKSVLIEGRCGLKVLTTYIGFASVALLLDYGCRMH